MSTDLSAADRQRIADLERQARDGLITPKEVAERIAKITMAAFAASLSTTSAKLLA